jgi:hypothetical protein
MQAMFALNLAFL